MLHYGRQKDMPKLNWKEKACIIHEYFVKKRGETMGSDGDRRYIALALGGEAGEMQNLVKKEWRGDFKKDKKKHAAYDTFKYQLAAELADIRIYLELLGAAYDIDLDVACETKTEELRRRWPQINKPIAKAEKLKS
jgi:NTP pyrophosphatase (non-canonical NTP hydrolase)